jgi:hypothetical protein
VSSLEGSPAIEVRQISGEYTNKTKRIKPDGDGDDAIEYPKIFKGRHHHRPGITTIANPFTFTRIWIPSPTVSRPAAKDSSPAGNPWYPTATAPVAATMAAKAMHAAVEAAMTTAMPSTSPTMPTPAAAMGPGKRRTRSDKRRD